MADPDFQIRGGGWGVGHPDPEMRGGPSLKKKNWGASVWSKNKRGRLPGLSPGSTTATHTQPHTSTPRCMFVPILSGLLEETDSGILLLILYQILHVHHPQGLGTLSQVVCHIW